MDIKLNGEKNRVFFNEKIDEYDTTHESFMSTKKEITNNLPSSVTKVLDLGAGTGLELIYLFEKYPNVNVTAVDISENMLERLKERSFSNNVKTICGNFFDVDFGNNYDAVISTSALHHFFIDDKLELYKKIYNSLNDGGIFLNADKIASTDQDELDDINYYNNNISTHPHCDTPLTIEHELEILKQAGFKNISVLNVDKENYRLFKAYK